MPFAVGDDVLVRSLGRGLVRELRNGGRCLVEIKGRMLLIREQDLSPADARQLRRSMRTPEQFAIPDHQARASAPSEVDLHGLTSSDGVTALDTFLNDAILAGLSSVRVIHGRSGGRLKAAVHKRLKQLPSVRGFRRDPANPGVTIVSL
jgi:DNA mismatch repair protein MutS2